MRTPLATDLARNAIELGEAWAGMHSYPRERGIVAVMECIASAHLRPYVGSNAIDAPAGDNEFHWQISFEEPDHGTDSHDVWATFVKMEQTVKFEDGVFRPVQQGRLH